jgi:hypothetical protein
MIEDSYACRKGKGREPCAEKIEHWLKKANRSGKKWYYLKLDISKYFYRVDHQTLIRILKKRIKDQDLMNILEMYIDCSDKAFGLPRGCSAEDCMAREWLYEVGIPIGNLLSQLFANIYLNELDQFVKHKLRAHMYVRYMDDVLILSDDKNELVQFLKEIEKFLYYELFLQLNKKTEINCVTHGIEFIGYRFYGTHRLLRKSSARRMIRSYKYLCKAINEDKITEEYLFRVTQSFKGIMMHSNCKGLARKLNEIYADIVYEPLESIGEIPFAA